MLKVHVAGGIMLCIKIFLKNYTRLWEDVCRYSLLDQHHFIRRRKSYSRYRSYRVSSVSREALHNEHKD